MPRTFDPIEALIKDVFRRISSGGKDSVSVCFTEDAIYEGAYYDQFIDGNEAITAMLGKAIPAAIHPFAQWPIAVYPVSGGDMVIVEYKSHGMAVWNNQIYENKYTGVMKLRDGKISFWREYYDPARFEAAVGPNFEAVIARLMPPGSMKEKSGPSYTARAQSNWTVSE